MTTSIFINEIRIPLSSLEQLDILHCSTSTLSSRHKRGIERALSARELISFFEGDVLFVLPENVADLTKTIDSLRSALNNLNVQKAASLNIKSIKLRQAPQRVLERMSFAILSYQARKQGIFSLFGRTFFKPTADPQKLAHKSVETTLTVDNGFVKLYLTPSVIALTSIEETYRERLPDLELINLCKFRVKNVCELANNDGSCPYIIPSAIGYFDKSLSIDDLDDSETLVFKNRYRDCPKIENVSKVILAKATRKAKKYTVYPPFMIFAGISKEDLHSKPTVLRQYRDATLMPSSKRWIETIKWIKDIFKIKETMLPPSVNIKYGELNIPAHIILLNEIKNSINSISGYRSIAFPDQKVINEQNNPVAKSYGGGWLFSTQGAFDRESLDRPFDSIRPYLVVPDIDDIPDLSRKLMEILTDGMYKERTSQGDQEFFGINHSTSQSKYHVNFLNPWKEEEGIYLLPDAEEATYKNYLQDIKRDWNSNAQRDMSRLAIIITPTSKIEENELYYKLKKILFEEGIPSQFISINTLNKLGDPNAPFGPTLQSLWLNIYAKMGGKPWRLASQMENVHCFIGVGFGMNTAKERGKHIFAGFAHVFDKFGNWIDIASGSQTITDDDHESFFEPQKYLQGSSSFKISKNITQEVIYNALKLYQCQQTQTGETPRNIVLHKLGPVYESEVIGFLEGVRQLLGTMENCKLGIVQIEQDHQIKLYGPESTNQKADRTVARGFGVLMGTNTIALASTGCVNRGNKGLQYFGIGTPQPLLITSVSPSQGLMQQYGLTINNFYDVESLTKHIMALTQLHWGSTRDNIRLPITAMYAQKVADLISKTDALVDTWESYHRPWFL